MDITISLAKACFAAEESPMWKTNPERANEIHGEACDAMWIHLRNACDENQTIKPAVSVAKEKASYRAMWKNQLRGQMIDSLNAAIEDLH